MSFQWRKGGLDLPGAADSALILTNVTGSHAGDYTVVIANDYGAVTSHVATLTVSLSPVIVTHPASQMVQAGSAVQFAVSATGQPSLSYQWFKDATPLTNATQSILTLNHVHAADAGRTSRWCSTPTERAPARSLY